jgi:hypothetical protein
MSDLAANLRRLFDAVVAEAEQNPAFAARLEGALSSIRPVPAGTGASPSTPPPPTSVPSAAPPKKRAGRRAGGVLDPFAVDQEGEGVLRARLSALSLDELKDIVAEHGMDPSKLAMKWKKPERLVDLIATTVSNRLHKGDAFR